jgi:hypothetical protein
MSNSELTPEILELILRTSRVKGCHAVYALAPRGHRVGIYFQQRRATLLAAAITSRLGADELARSKIGIIGGGVSGLTFLLAMKSEGAENTFLYEAADRILTTGNGASHRLVHPNYNRWPLLGSMDMFTNLPTLNWHADSADQVVSQLRQQIEEEYGELIKNCVKFQHVAKRVIQRDIDELTNPLRVTFETSKGEERADFRIVVIAAGFGDEDCTKWGFGDYWKRDPENYDVDQHKRPTAIYGTGDGALIDTIRCCAANPDDAWRMPLGTIARLRSGNAITIRRDSTTSVERRANPFTSFEKKIQSHEEHIRSTAWTATKRDDVVGNAYAEQESRFYRGCIKEFSQSLRDFLEIQLKPLVLDPRLRPVMIGTLKEPFEPTSAPINKLLLAYLLETDRIAFDQRERRAIEAELERCSRESAPDRNKKIVICRFGATRNFPITNEPPPSHGISVRLENDNTGAITKETDIEAQFVDALSGVTGGEYVYFDAMPHPLTKARFDGDSLAKIGDIRRRNKPILTSFAKQHLEADDVRLEQAENKDKPKWVITTALSDDAITEKLTFVGGLDGNFLGAPIVVADSARSEKGNF